MLFHKLNTLKTVFVLHSLLTLIAAMDGNEGGSSSESSDHSVCKGYPTQLSDTELKEQIFDTSCWRRMMEYCEKDDPTALDFAKISITSWVLHDVFNRNFYFKEYFLKFENCMKAEKITPPDRFCLEIEGENAELLTSRSETQCQASLYPFGSSNGSALYHAFYERTPEDYPNVVMDYSLDKIAAMVKSKKFNFKDYYIKHIVENVEIVDEMQSPLNACLKLHEELVRRYEDD